MSIRAATRTSRRARLAIRPTGDPRTLSRDTVEEGAALRMMTWRRQFRMSDHHGARDRLSVQGDAALADPFLHARAVMV